MGTPPVQRTVMPDWVYRAAIRGKNEARSVPDQRTKKLVSDYFQSTTYMGNTVLHILATYGHNEFASMICWKDWSMWKRRNKMFETPFHCAAKVGHEMIISTLLEFASREEDLKAVLRQRNKCGETALHEAAKHGHVSVVSVLMKVDPLLACEFNDDGASSLYLAAARKTLGDDVMVEEILKQLLEHNINPVYSDGQNHKKLPDSSLASAVAEGVDLSKTKPIHFLASSGKACVVKQLLETDSSLAYLQDSEGLFPIHFAARAGNAEMVALFIHMFPDSAELLDDRGRNLFHIAAEENVLDAIFKLIMKDLNVLEENVLDAIFKILRDCFQFILLLTRAMLKWLPFLFICFLIPQSCWMIVEETSSISPQKKTC